MNYVVLDLEMCKVLPHYRNKKYPHPLEIIQIGAVLLNEKYQIIASLNQYVKPEYGALNGFITNLTGIQNYQIKEAPLLEENLLHMLDWIGEREYQIFAWSKNDFTQLSHEIKSKGIQDERIERFMDPKRWCDYQELFGKRYELHRAIGLEEALMLCGLDLEGRAHDGLDDAINTAHIIELLELHPEFEIMKLDVKSEPEPLSTSLGELFAGLNLGLE